MKISRTTWRGRRAWLLDNETLRAVILEGGGHLASLTLAECESVNPLWAPPWATMEPAAFKPRDAARLGDKLLASIAGHNLCLGCFGGPSEEEGRAGLGGHGEAPVARWRVLARRVTAGGLLFRIACELPVAQLRCVRTITAKRGAACCRVTDEIENLSRRDLPYTMCQHVTLGPPFLEKGVTRCDMSATRAHSFPGPFGNPHRVKTDAAFTWPQAPGARGGTVDLRYLDARTRSSSDFTTQLMDPRREQAWFSAVNPRLGLLLAYVWPRADYPWVGNWEENLARTAAPWNGRTLARGMEFANTPFPVSLRAAVDRHRLFGESTYRWIPARSLAKSTFTILMATVSPDAQGVRHVEDTPTGPVVTLDG